MRDIPLGVQITPSASRRIKHVRRASNSATILGGTPAFSAEYGRPG
jgi:hypothetical protein